MLSPRQCLPVLPHLQTNSPIYIDSKYAACCGANGQQRIVQSRPALRHRRRAPVSSVSFQPDQNSQLSQLIPPC